MSSGRTAARAASSLHIEADLSPLERVLRAHPGRWSLPTVATARAEQLALSVAEWPPFLDELDALFARVLPPDF